MYLEFCHPTMVTLGYPPWSWGGLDHLDDRIPLKSQASLASCATATPQLQ